MDGIMALGTGLIGAETRRVKIAGQNIANVATPGYKRAVAFRDVLGTSADAMGKSASADTVATDFSAGKLIHTGNPFDLAINGPGFFEVATTDGPAYTRLGAFQRDASGRLVTSQGWPLQGSAGDIKVSSDAWRVERDGTVIDGGNSVGAVNIVDFAKTAELKRTADGLFVSNGAAATPVDAAQLSQGYIEASNVSVAQDMLQMMEAMRRIESGQKLIHVYDDMMGAAIQRLGEM
ncbi:MULTISPECIES: flagellar hook-basal body protein [unclassified Caballeronia]|uniref:flagellar hook-basal body protein n=1 Tax=unclassified Caballeronia TaxID=2646786 RepID=UPI00285F0086|nr:MULTISPECIES: flagellar hook-basal body protein [unclassified Caballeronia]MDR5774164.1 flagellar hook-basal body protein [Caballeronia sp. LZ002]MDR5849599.1 flagellar hook-basal body protein [Caballeronia sp. LZ003]